MNAVIEQAAARLIEAIRAHTPCAPVRDLLSPGDMTGAYEVQQRVLSELYSPADIVGRKIGLTSPAVQEQLGVDRPDFGVLYAWMEVPDGGFVTGSQFLQPRIEGEIAFRLGADLDAEELTYSDVVAAIDAMAPALEICDSRIAHWDITFVDTVADNASAGGFVVGDWVNSDPCEALNLHMALETSGTGEKIRQRGVGSACLGDPIEAVRWLAVTARAFGTPLRAGQIVLSGALAPMVALIPGRNVTMTIDALGSVSVTREQGEA